MKNLLNMNKIIKKHIKNGVFFLDKEKVLIDDEVKIKQGTVIGSGVVIKGSSEIGENSEITGDCYIENSKIGDSVKVKSSYIIDSEVGNKTTVGPFSHIKQKSRIGENCRIGSYVEIKNSVLGDCVKSTHLAYIGDAEVGNSVNIGCGVVFANYDGKTKSHTFVGKNVFIGCNSNLVAPLNIADDCYIAAGTTVTKDLEKNNFCIGRVRQENKNINDCDFLKFISDDKKNNSNEKT